MFKFLAKPAKPATVADLAAKLAATRAAAALDNAAALRVLGL